ncbi:inorganic phosphate transporter [Paroceanicella profunda]|uniref:Phosphate transporter n=1 Tax=Paroceanicella profunda TaxID=2579971 RepID=A0A5B8FZI4_9RHOB|nr:inorganic phosphate transporter [Paroceanicella profunda]QDL92800.1 inorganic phosphate transporter [Paroceanicella profunda]
MAEPPPPRNRSGPAAPPRAHGAAASGKLTTVDKDLRRIGRLEQATLYLSRPLVAPGLALVALLVAALAGAVLFHGSAQGLMLPVALTLGTFLALNIGANDVANNMGPLVGSRVLPMGAALLLAAGCEVLGAVLAGGDVAATVGSGLVRVPPGAAAEDFILAMIAALAAAALWLNIATLLGAPVSTTHCVVGAVAGSGALFAGLGAVNWGALSMVAAGWLASPLLSGAVAAGMLLFVNTVILEREEKIAAARLWVPVMTGVTIGCFASYAEVKGIGPVTDSTPLAAGATGLAFGVAGALLTWPVIARRARGLENRNRDLRHLFALPLVLSAALLSFAHGANDVANVVGPLAAIIGAGGPAGPGAIAGLPGWAMAAGAGGISLGMLLFGPRLVRLVGHEITRLNPARSFCVLLASALIVLAASSVGLPVSSTHTAIGALFGVGFSREWSLARGRRHSRKPSGKGDAEEPNVEELSNRRLVRRSHVVTILAAWAVTVPASAILSAFIYLFLHTFIR